MESNTGLTVSYISRSFSYSSASLLLAFGESSPKQVDLAYTQPTISNEFCDTDSWPMLRKPDVGRLCSNILGSQCVTAKLARDDCDVEDVLVVIGESGTSGTGGLHGKS